mmetsp:Transcript_3778/g.4155  ORF Transcript_3778/g.4155 Transcript_3778/m.4155 type:complete len:169 (+) Transcript_3778:97-603(+)
MSVRRRAKEMNQNIRNSEVFPRIRDTERLMIEDEILFRKRRERKKKKQENLLKEKENGYQPYQEKNKKRLDSTHLPPITKKAAKSNDINNNNNTTSPAKSDYFSSFVLNRDPNCSQYMPFNEVFYPNLFNPLIDSNNPHSIDMVWMLGFQHDALHKSIEVKVKKEFKS